MVIWTFFGICLSLGLEWKTDLSPSCGRCWVFQISWHVECSNLIASSFRIWNSSAGIASPPLALFIVILPNAHLTSHSRTSSSGWVTHQHWCYSKRGVSKMSTEHVPPHPPMFMLKPWSHYVEAKVIYLEVRPWGVTRTWGWSLHKREVPLWEEPRERFSRFPLCADTASGGPSANPVSPDTESAGNLSLRLLASSTVRN